MRPAASRAGFPFRVVGAASTTTAIANLPAFLFGAFAVQIRFELGFSPAGIGLVAGAFFATSSLAAPIAGRLVQKGGAALSIRVASIGTAASLLVIAAVVQTWAALLALMSLAGAMNSTGQTAANLALAEYEPLDQQGLAFGLKQSAVPLGTMAAGMAVPVFATLGWRWAFVSAAAAALVVGLVAPRLSAPLHRASDPGGSPERRRSSRHVDWPVLAFITISAFFGAGVCLALAVYFVEYAVTVGWRHEAAGLLLAGASTSVIFVRIFAGWRIDRRAATKASASALVPASLLIAAGAFGYLLLVVSEQWPFTLVVGTLLALGLGWSWGGLMHFTIVALHRGSAAVATGIVLFGVFAGGVAVPPLLGVLVEQFSYRVAWVTSAVAMALAAGAMYAAHWIVMHRRGGGPIG